MPITKSIKGLRFFFFLICIPHSGFAQFRKTRFIKPGLSVGYQSDPASDFIDTSGHYGFDKINVDFRLPLYTRMLKGSKAGSFGFGGILLNMGGAYVFPHFSAWTKSRQLLNFHTGFQGLFYAGGKSVYMAGINGFMAEDNGSVNHPLIRYNGSVMMIHQVNKTFSFIAGASYSFVYGNGFPFPVLGARLNIGKRSKLNIIMPFSISYRYLFGTYNDFRISLKPDGGIFRITNYQHEFDGHPETLSFRQRAFVLGASVTFFVGGRLGITPEAGLHGKRSLFITDDSGKSGDAFFMEKTGAGVFLRLGLNYRFGIKPYHGENDAVNYLMEKDIDDLPLDGVEN